MITEAVKLRFVHVVGGKFFCRYTMTYVEQNGMRPGYSFEIGDGETLFRDRTRCEAVATLCAAAPDLARALRDAVAGRLDIDAAKVALEKSGVEVTKVADDTSDACVRPALLDLGEAMSRSKSVGYGSHNYDANRHCEALAALAKASERVYAIATSLWVEWLGEQSR